MKYGASISESCPDSRLRTTTPITRSPSVQAVSSRCDCTSRIVGRLTRAAASSGAAPRPRSADRGRADPPSHCPAAWVRSRRGDQRISTVAPGRFAGIPGPVLSVARSASASGLRPRRGVSQPLVVEYELADSQASHRPFPDQGSGHARTPSARLRNAEHQGATIESSAAG
jgi:hypothetical protein